MNIQRAQQQRPNYIPRTAGPTFTQRQPTPSAQTSYQASAQSSFPSSTHASAKSTYAQASIIVQPPPQTTSPAQAQGQTGQRQPSVPAPLAPPANVLRHPPPPLTSPNTTNIPKASGTRAPAPHNLHHSTTQKQNLFHPHPTDTRSEHKHQVMAAP